MKKVIDYTNDKKMYNFCSDELKANPNFAVYLVDKFHEDLDFIQKVFYNCIDKYEEVDDNKEQTPEEREKSKGIFELYVLLYKYIKDEKLRLKIAVFINMECVFLNVSISMLKSSDELIPQGKELLQMGFAILVSEYGKHEHLMKYFANRFIDDIFETNKIDLEVLLHERFDTYQELEEYGINRYLISLLSNYDSYLGDYIANHLDILDVFKNQLFNIKLRWMGYIKKQQNQILEEENNDKIMLKMIESCVTGSPTEYMDFYPYYKIISKKLNIWDKVCKCHPSYKNRTDEVEEDKLDYSKLSFLEELLRREIPSNSGNNNPNIIDIKSLRKKRIQ